MKRYTVVVEKAESKHGAFVPDPSSVVDYLEAVAGT
jgi:hypothetical protein